MNEYSEIEVRRQFPLKSVWNSEYGNVTVIDHIPDHDGMGYIIKFKKIDGSEIGLHPYFVGKRIY
jgi:hypothetical protein